MKGERKNMDRRIFIKLLSAAPFAAVASRILTACGKTDATNLTLSCSTTGLMTSVTSNHTSATYAHALTVPYSDVQAGVEKTYDIKGATTSHSHYITLTQADFASILNGDSITKTATLGGTNNHPHDVTVKCSA